MDVAQLFFLGLAFLILVSAIFVVTTRNLVHAALWLIVTLFAIAILYASLNAGFLAVVQVVVYIGAIAILFIFAVMLTRREIRDSGAQHNRGWWLSAMVALLAFGGLVAMLTAPGGIWKAANPMPAELDAVGLLGDALISPDAFVLPFEVASILLVAALIGAVYAAFTRSQEKP